MTITYVAAGTVVTGSNTSLSPGLPAGVVDGDLMLLTASIRNSGTGVPVAPAGWTAVTVFGNVGVFYRRYATGVTAPTVTFTGGVALADTQAAIIAFRGVSLEEDYVVATLLNASAANIAYPALDVPGSKHAVVLVAWKQDDSATLSTPAAFTRPVYSSTTTGDDATLAVYYSIQTTEADITASSLTVTGGAAAISRGIVISIKPKATLTVSEQDSWPTRVLVAVTDVEVGDAVGLYRVVGGNLTALRAGVVAAATNEALVTVDAELPFGVPVSYLASVNGTEYTSPQVTYELVGGNVALTDAITGASAEVVAGAAGPRAFKRDATRFRVAGRNLVVMGDLGQGEGSYDLVTVTTPGRNALLALLQGATQGIVQIRVPGVSAVTGEAYDGVDAYLAVDQVTETRFSQDGSDPRRIFTIEFAETDGWDASLEARGYTWADVVTYFGASGTWANLVTFMGVGGTWLDVAIADWSS